MFSRFVSKYKLEAHGKGFASVRYDLPAALFLDDFANNRGKFCFGR